MDYERTKMYLGAKYVKNNPTGKTLSIGDKVIVHPTKTSLSRTPFEAEIISKEIPWSGRSCIEICTTVAGKHSAVMNDYLFNRLEPKKL